MTSIAIGQAPGPLGRARRWLGGFRRTETWAAYGFLLPWIFGFVALTAGPMFWSLYLSFTNYGIEQVAGLEPTESVGFEHYRELANDPKIVQALENTAIFSVMSVPGTMIVALLLAMMLLRIGRAAGFFRTVFYLPQITPPVAVGILFLTLFNGSVGLVNRFLGLFGVEQGPFWTTDPDWIKPGLAIMEVWAVGGTMVIYLAALKSVPQHLYEAASIDGASAFRKFRDVTLPMISPALFFTFIVLTIAGLTTFDKAYTAFFGAGGGGAGAEDPDAALFYSIYLFRQGFEFFHFGYAAAMAWLLFGIIMVITAVQFFVSRRFVYYQGAQR